jgi:hypothetical protein
MFVPEGCRGNYAFCFPLPFEGLEGAGIFLPFPWALGVPEEPDLRLDFIFDNFASISRIFLSSEEVFFFSFFPF